MGGLSTAADDLVAIYRGEVVHKRTRPKRHALRYPVFAMLIDLDRLADVDASRRWFSVGRWNLFSLKLADFGPRDGTDLASFARERARLAGLTTSIARVRMLFYPRILGYAFNPITVYYLDDASGRLRMLLYEVRNTFGEHHFYSHVVKVGDDAEVHHALPKAFYVSPFNTFEGEYRFAMRPPHDEVFTGITLVDGEGALLTAYFSGTRAPANDSALLRLSLAYPLMTLRIIAGIHIEALKLWVKGVPHTLGLRAKPAVPKFESVQGKVHE